MLNIESDKMRDIMKVHTTRDFLMKAEPTPNDINALDKEEESEAPKKTPKQKAARSAGWHIGH